MELEQETSRFMKASIILSILAILTIQFVILPFIFGGLSIIFAILERGARKKFSSMNMMAIILSSSAMVVTVITVSFVMHTVMTNPSYRQQLNDYSKQIYGQTFDEMLNETFRPE